MTYSTNNTPLGKAFAKTLEKMAKMNSRIKITSPLDYLHGKRRGLK